MELSPKDAELIIGIVTRIGVDKSSAVLSIKEELEKYHYQVFHIRVTEDINGFDKKFQIVERPTDARYSSYIDACNEMRNDLGDSIMAKLAIINVAACRQKADDTAGTQARNAFIIDQIKRPEEFELLRKLYGEHYVQMSFHAGEDKRIGLLTELIARDHPEDLKSSKWDIAARQLVHRDESEEGEKHGQRVRRVFPLSDVIVDATSTVRSQDGIARFFRGLFGDKSVSPTREEFGMELANSAAQRSSDLSRQVGAAILKKTMEVVAIGCNEVPRGGGGAYWEGDEPDGRDFALGRDFNEQRRKAVLTDLLLRLEKTKILKEACNVFEEVETILGDIDSPIADSQLMDSLEYGRTVHAEMSAITDAARVGHSTQNCTLYSNTFPCHNCAKHIVAAGISEVIYIHPYPKSYAKELFSDSILVNAPLCDSTKVVFRQFIGIQGPMYARVFTKARWKSDEGLVAAFQKSEASYIRRSPTPSYEKTESLILDELGTELAATGYLQSDEKTNSDAMSSS